MFCLPLRCRCIVDALGVEQLNGAFGLSCWHDMSKGGEGMLMCSEHYTVA
jgi:hypothetical protein